MDIRDVFALECAKYILADSNQQDKTWVEISRDSYEFADAMIKEREKNFPNVDIGEEINKYFDAKQGTK